MAFQGEAGSEPRYGWVMVAVAAVIMGVGTGSVTSISVFLKPLIAEFGWLRGETAFAYTAATLAMGVCGILMGYLSDRYSTRAVVLAGTLGIGLSFLLLARQDSLWQLYLFYCLLGGAAFDAPLLANVGSWFDKNKGLALGVTTAVRSLGQGFVPYLASYLISTSGWRGAYSSLGVLSLAVLVPLALLVRSPPVLGEERRPRGAEAPPAPRETCPAPPWVIVPWFSVAVIFCCMCMATPLVHVVALAQDRGIDAQSAAGVLLLIYVAGFIGRVSFGKITDHIGGIRAYLLASACQTVLVFWFTQIHSLASLNILALLFGLGYSGVMTCFIICVRELIPPQVRGLSTGIVMAFAWVGMGLGAFQAGFFFDLTGNYTLSFANAALAGLINLVIVASLHRYVAHRQPALEG